MSAPFATQILGWKQPSKTSQQPVPNSADSTNGSSKAIAGRILQLLGVPDDSEPPVDPKTLGPRLERLVQRHLEADLMAVAPERKWVVDHKNVISDFYQYGHLRNLQSAVNRDPVLSADLGFDYLIKPDVTVGLLGAVADMDRQPFLHAAVSCKWTIRSDRVQNIRHEFLQIIKHRRGRLPHLVTVTAEPLPSRIAAIARGTGEVDAVYHIALDALQQAVSELGTKQQKNDLAECIGQGRLKPYEELAKTLATW